MASARKRDHVRGLAHGFAVGDLGLAFVQVLDAEPEEVRAAGERKTRTRGIVAKIGHRQAGRKTTGGNIVVVEPPQRFGDEQGRAEFVDGLVPRQQEVLLVKRSFYGAKFGQNGGEISHILLLCKQDEQYARVPARGQDG